MVTTKKINEGNFSKLVKEMNAAGEMIRTHQEEKQAVLDEFDQERKRYLDGKISKRTLMSSVAKSNKELIRLDKDIRNTIKRVETLTSSIRTLSANQSPKVYRTSVLGIKLLGKKSRSAKKGRSKPNAQPHKNKSSSKKKK